MGRFSPNITANYLAGCAHYNPNGVAITAGCETITRQQLMRRVFRLANLLVRRGVGPGEPVCTMFFNTARCVEATYAVQVAGGVPTPLNYRFTEAEIQRQLDHSEARIVLCETSLASAVTGAAVDLPAVDVLLCDSEETDKNAINTGNYDDSDPRIAVAPDDVAAMVYTGGTTGFPKGVMLSYGAHVEMFSRLLANIAIEGVGLDLTDDQLARVAETAPLPGARQLIGLARLGPIRRLATLRHTRRSLRAALRRILSDPRFARLGYGNTLGYMVPSLPFFHGASFMLLMLGPMLGNIRFDLVSGGTFDVDEVLSTVERRRPLLMANVPAGWKKLVEHPDIERYDRSSLRVAISGSGVCSTALKKKIFDKFPGVIFIDMFGQTEMTPLTAFRIDTGPHSLKHRSVGKPIVEARIVDEQGNELPSGEIGELLYRSNTMMKGYFKESRVEDHLTDDGWFRSGDLAYIDDEGEIRIQERKKECINSGGEKVFPMEVEEVLCRHRAVDQVCVIGIDDPTWGQAVRAVVQLRPGAEAEAGQLIAHCRTDLAGYKVPKTVIFVDKLPLSPVGKVLRKTIRKQWGAAGSPP